MPKLIKTARGQPRQYLTPSPDGTYQCQRIMDLRIQKGERLYLVKWKGYDDPSDNTWQPMSNLENLLEDLIRYEETHQPTIKKFQQRWIKLYEERRVREPLKQFHIARMKRKLEKMRREAENANSESQYSEKDAGKTKKIEKEKTGSLDTHSRMAKRTEQVPRKKRTEMQNPALEKRLYKKRGRKSLKQREEFLKELELRSKMLKNECQPPLDHFSDFSKVIPIRQVHESAEYKEPIQEEQMEDQDLELSPEKICNFQTPKRNGCTIEEKRTTSHKQEKQEKQKEDKDEDDDEQEKEKPANEGQNSEVQQSKNDKFIDQIMENRPEQTQQLQQETINTNIVASVLSKRMQRSRSNDSDSSQEYIPKKQSVFKLNNFNRANTNCNSRLSSPKKYIYHPKKKLGRFQRSDSESESCNGSVKPFLGDPIIELDEEQKDSTPVSIKCFQKNEAEERRQEEEPNKENEEMLQQLQQKQRQEEVAEAHENQKNQEAKEANEQQQENSSIQEVEPNQQVIENNALVSNQEPNQQQNNQIVAQLSQPRHEESKPINNQDKFAQSEKQIVSQAEKNVDDWLFNYQKKPQQAQCIILTENNSNFQEESHPSKEPEEAPNYKARFTPYFTPNFISKSKKIKKETRENQLQPKRECRGIIGRSEQALVLDSQDNVHYRPSLNTLFQKMITISELQYLKEVSLVKILSNFKLENVIIFSVRVIIRKKMDIRYISYQALHQYFPKQLLSFLEEQGKIDL